MNRSHLFTADGHVAIWVFFPNAWGGDDYWCEGFSDAEKKEIFDHMKSCHICRAAEIEATLRWAELRPRATNAEILSTSPIAVSAQKNEMNLSFESYPIYLLDYILQFAKGTSIEIDRDESNRVKRLTGMIDGEIESDIVFIYDDDTTTIHCYCHNCEHDPISTQERLSFADLHIYLAKERQLNFSIDNTEFYPECREIKKYHSFHKIVFDNFGRVINIQQDNKPWYRAEYDDQQKLIRKALSTISTEYQYSNGLLVNKKSMSNDETIEEETFEYADNQPGPVRTFSISELSLRLKNLNVYCKTSSETFRLGLEFDGVPRYYYTSSGNLFLKVLLPLDASTRGIPEGICELEDIPEKFDTIEMYLVDTETNSMRILRKEKGSVVVDQTSRFEDGLLRKVYNEPNALRKTVSTLHFVSRHWTEIVEIDQNIL